MASLYDDPRLYDLLFETEPFLGFYKALAQSQNGGVLELGCGTGQLLIPMADLGLPCTGVDNHAGMLAVARERASAARAHVSLVEADMREFSFDARFALIFVARNSLLHLLDSGDLEQCFARVREHLAPDGLFAFDVFNPSISLLARPPSRRDEIQRVRYPGRGTVTVEASVDYDAAHQVNRATWHVTSDTDANVLVAPLHLRCIFPEELLLMLEHFGFDLEARYGDFASAPFRSSSRQQVCLCRPAASARSNDIAEQGIRERERST